MSNLSGINEIFERCIKGVATEEDRLLFWKWADTPGNEDTARQLVEQAFPSVENQITVNYDTFDSMMEAIFNASTATEDLKSVADSVSVNAAVHRIHFLRNAWFRYAALLLLIAGSAALFYLNHRPQKKIVSSQPLQYPDIQSGVNKATLTLADGSIIVLDSSAIGSLAQQGNTKILKLDAGALAYEAGNSEGETMYNTIATPKGGQYQLVLTDGTKVWLNAASSLRFPTRFSTTERSVELKGEGYFEVAPDKTAPFFVKANGMQVHALGTGFNLMAYDDEQDIRTTLEKGSVEVSISGRHQLLIPGEQAKWAYASDNLTKQKVEVSRVTAWKNGVFDFKGADLHAIMRQVSRWYDVEVKYQGNLDGIALSGIVSRKANVSKLIEIIEATERVQFEKKGSVITVMPYVKK